MSTARQAVGRSQCIVSHSAPRRYRRTGLVILLVGALAFDLWWLLPGVSAVPQLIIAAGLLIGLAVVLRGGWLHLFGPMFFYDAVRLGRSGPAFLVRAVYPALVFLLLAGIYVLSGGGSKALARLSAPRAPRNGPHAAAFALAQLAKFAEDFFLVFMIFQLVLAVVLTPLYTAGAFAEEKEKKRLDFLLTTDLDDREVVLGKLAARAVSLSLVLLAGLPVLALTQFWGGIDPNLLLAGFAATGITIASVASVSTLVSVTTKRAREAIIKTYLVVGAFVVLTLIPDLYFFYRFSPSTVMTNRLLVGQNLEAPGWLEAGNPACAILWLRRMVDVGKPLSAAIPVALARYCVFHGLVAVVSCALAVRWVRAGAISAEGAKAKVCRARSRPWRSFLRDRPVLWKELFIERAMTQNWFGRAVVAAIVLASFLPAFWIIFRSVRSRLDPWYGLAGGINDWVRLAGTLIACLTLLGVAIRAAGSITNERERQTLDSLLITRVELRDILLGKWLASIVSVRWAAGWLATIWAIGVLTGGLNVIVIPWLVVAWLVYAAFLAAMGLYFSARGRSGLQATLWTLIFSVALSGSHWLPTLVLGTPTARPRYFGVDSDWWGIFHTYALTPPVALAWLGFRGTEFYLRYIPDFGGTGWEHFLAIMEGLVLWGLGTMFFLLLSNARFRMSVGRTPGDQARAERPRRRLSGLLRIILLILAVWLVVAAWMCSRGFDTAFTLLVRQLFAR
jgi:ABC-type transport system involved in multi-copper enzyme maturation permease subunit